MIRDGLKDPTFDPESNEIPLNFDGNNRDVQDTKDREVVYFDRENSCGADDDGDALKRFKEMQDEQAQLGHYEKVEKKAMKYFFVPSKEPSGVPGAFVISKKEAEGK